MEIPGKEAENHLKNAKLLINAIQIYLNENQ